MSTSPRVLVVDDEESLRHMLSLFLSKDGFQVWTASSGREALEQLKSGERFDLCVSDVRMPGMDGLAFIQEAVRLGERAPTFVAMSAYGDKALALEALRRGAFDYISKPFEPSELVIKLRLILERDAQAQGRERAAARAGASGGAERASLERRHDRGAGPSAVRPIADIVVASPELQAIAKTVRRVAAYPSTVLITGETGTGKERIAQAIHAESPRASRPFVAVNSAAIPDNLLESELFGHAKGAFTDAHADRVGLFELAHGGTLFLDEIAELPIHLQVKLLRVLVEGEIRPVGATRNVPVDIRFVSATSRDLTKLIAEGRFREDLFHRLNVVPIHVPPLRERPSDIRPLAHHFAERLARRLGVRAIALTEPALAALEAYEWPGNVRELENAIERAFVLSDGTGTLTEADLDDRFDAPAAETAAPEHDVPRGADDLRLKPRLDELERQLIRQALEKTGGNRGRTAEVLGISQRALLYKLKEYGLS
jgi:two-component system response regulator AtoC